MALLRRLLMVLVGLAVLAVYVAAAYGGLLLLALVWIDRPSPVTALALVVGLTLVVGYLSYRFGTARLLSAIDATAVPRGRFPDLDRRLDRLVGEMDVGRPDLLVARMAAPNALSLGGAGGGTVVLDRGLLRLLTPDELETILAHELAHLERRDVLVRTLAYSAMQTVVGVVFVLLLPLLLLATGAARAVAWASGRPTSWSTNPFGRVRVRVEQVVMVVLIVLTMLVLAQSRRREYAADDRAAAVTGKPLALARALRKIQRASEPGGVLSVLSARRDDDPLVRLFSTHPPTDERIERLVARADRSARRIPVR